MKARKELSSQAATAKECRAYLKTLGIKCRATSSSFSMGDSVTVTVYDQPPAIIDKITEHLKQHQYGHFDGMTDYYDNSNTRDDIPQTKYLSVNNEKSDALRQAAWDYIRNVIKLDNAPELPELYSEAHDDHLTTAQGQSGEWVSQLVHRVFSGAEASISADFWALQLAANTPAADVVPINGASARIEEHTHTKRDFQMFIVIVPRVDRAQYDSMLDAARAAGGWYSRKWGKTPAGFAFKHEENAAAFLANTQADAATTPASEAAPAVAPNYAVKLRELADNLTDKIADKLADRQTNTPKRVAQAASARADGHRLERTQTALNALADHHDADTVPAVLAGIKNKKAVFDCMGSTYTPVNNGYHGYNVENGEPRDNDAVTLALWALLTPKSAEQTNAEALAREIEALQFTKIAGYVPTPPAVIETMLQHARLTEHSTVLEPSAGSGAIVDAVRESTPTASIDVCEVNHTLAAILERKGCNVVANDFTTLGNGKKYDSVLMNPPFELLADAAHVRFAYNNCLAVGGRLVSIMSPAVFFHSNVNAMAWRGWFETNNGYKIDLPANSFKESGTNVNTVMVVIDK